MLYVYPKKRLHLFNDVFQKYKSDNSVNSIKFLYYWGKISRALLRFKKILSFCIKSPPLYNLVYIL